jgi:molecular chaperone GrpE
MMKKKSKEKPQEEIDTLKNQLEELRQKLTELQKEKDEVFGRLQRVSADYINFQKRTDKQIADITAYEKERIIKTLLPVLDNFEHILQNTHSARPNSPQAAEDLDTLVKGVKIIYDQMLDTMKLHGVEQISTLGKKFDPALHQAMLQRAEPGQQDDVVLEEIQKGYKLNGRVIRASRVIINKLIPEQEIQKAEGQKTEAEQKPQEN